ncbi:MAG: ATP-binding protein [Lachnospiraceae bacterium]|nr:ATP-binding protein [Lachnospiraceae bacterium]
MSLTNAQYDSILRSYERTQDQNRQLQLTHLDTVYQRIPEYREIEESISSLCVAQGKKMLMGDEQALPMMKQRLRELSEKKKQLLAEHGFSPDYLDPVYSCRLCQDTGYRRNQKCSCFEQKIIDLLYSQSNLSDMLERENFSTLSYDYYEGEDLKRYQEAVKAAQKFTQDFKTDYQNLFFCGTVGTGKSFLSNCIAKDLLDRGYSVIYFSAGALFDLLGKATFDAKSKDTLAGLQADLAGCDLLIIDDLGTELTNAFVASSLFSILNERHLAKHATLISTNLSLAELRDRYSDRIFSRISSHFKLYQFSGRDIRMIKKINMELRK